MPTSTPSGSGSGVPPIGGSVGSQEVVFRLTVDASGLKTGLADAKTSYSKFVGEMDTLTKKVVKSVQGSIDGLADSAKGFGPALVASYDKAIQGLQAKIKPITQPVVFDFKGGPNLGGRPGGGGGLQNFAGGKFTGLTSNRPLSGLGGATNAWDPSLNHLALGNTGGGQGGLAEIAKSTRDTARETRRLYILHKLIARGMINSGMISGAGLGGIGGGGGGGLGGGGMGGRGRWNYRNRRTPPGFDPMNWYAIQQAAGMVAGPIQQGLQMGRGLATSAQQLGYGYESGRYAGVRAQWGAGVTGVSAEQAAQTAHSMMSAHLTQKQRDQFGGVFAAMTQARGLDQGTMAGALRSFGGAGITGGAGVLELANVAKMNPFTSQEAVTSLSDFARSSQPFLRKYGTGALRSVGRIGAQITSGIGAEQGGAEAASAITALLGRVTNPADAKAQTAGAGIFGGPALQQFMKGDTSGLLKGLQRQAKHFESMTPEVRHAAMSNYAQALGIDVNVLDNLFSNAAKISSTNVADPFKNLGDAAKAFNDEADRTLNWFEKMTNVLGLGTSAVGASPIGQVAGMVPSGLQTFANMAIMYRAFGPGGGGAAASRAGKGLPPIAGLGAGAGGIKAGLGYGGYSPWGTLGTAGKIARVGGPLVAGAGAALTGADLISNWDKKNTGSKIAGSMETLGMGMMAISPFLAGTVVGAPLALATGIIGAGLTGAGMLTDAIFGGAASTGESVDGSGRSSGPVAVADKELRASIDNLAMVITQMPDTRGIRLTQTGGLRS